MISELDYREAHGITVRLTWDSEDNTCTLTTMDTDETECVLVLTDPATARDAFLHPGAYGALACHCGQCRGPQPTENTESEGYDADGGVAVSDEDADNFGAF